MSNKYCLNCGSEVPAGLKYCPVCGAPVQNNKPASRSQILFDVPDLPKEEDNPAQDIDQDENEKTQQLDLDVPSSANKETGNAKPASSAASRPSSAKPEKKKKFSVFIEDDDDDYDDEEDIDEPRHSHIGLVVFLILLAAVLAAFLYLYMNHRGPFASKRGQAAISEQTPQVTETAEPESSEAPAATEEAAGDSSIGTAVVVLDSVNVRDQPSLEGNMVRTVSQGESLPVYETTEADGYTWYRIGENEWAATDGTWFDYTPNN